MKAINIKFTSMRQSYHAKGNGKNQKKNTCIIQKINELSMELWKVIVGLIISNENYIGPNSVKSFPDLQTKTPSLYPSPPPPHHSVDFYDL